MMNRTAFVSIALFVGLAAYVAARILAFIHAARILQHAASGV